ncbi:MAG TPA: amidase family protein, partial [Acidimicrobiia bacterium]|nr:amidase family protein [Acidimicrobiia bacterium]
MTADMDLTRLTTRQIAAAVAAREVSAVEVIEAHLARIDAVNPRLNAVVMVLAESARQEAAALDERLAAGESPGPLCGVPVTVKANIDMAGLPTTQGVPALAEALVPLDAPVVERVRAAGAIPIGRTNLPDMALRIHTDSSLYGLTRNPWNPERTAAGSSGGDAVAVATGMSALGLGNDIGGSLRSPASACGIASIRPSAGRIPDAGFVPSEDPLFAAQVMFVQGPLARTVGDVRAALTALAGAHPRDPWSLDQPLEVATSPPRRVAVVAEPPGGTTDPRVAAAVRAAGDRLAEAGYEVKEITPPGYEDALVAWMQLIMTDLASVMTQLREVMGPDGLAFLEAVLAANPPLDAVGLSGVLVTRHRIARTWAKFFAEHALILSPTWTQLP